MIYDVYIVVSYFLRYEPVNKWIYIYIYINMIFCGVLETALIRLELFLTIVLEIALNRLEPFLNIPYDVICLTLFKYLYNIFIQQICFTYHMIYKTYIYIHM